MPICTHSTNLLNPPIGLVSFTNLHIFHAFERICLPHSTHLHPFDKLNSFLSLICTHSTNWMFFHQLTFSIHKWPPSFYPLTFSFTNGTSPIPIRPLRAPTSH